MPRWFYRAIAAAAALAVCVSAGLAGEGRKPVGVVELFTSQGCNSCPPADDVLASLSRRPDVVTLGYHVDYWDYLGWKDTLGRAENTARQYDYGKAFGIRSVYTPQAVINGRLQVNGADRVKIDGELKRLEREGQGLAVGVDVTRSGGSFVIQTGAAPSGAASAHLVLVYFDPVRAIEIKRGENQGRVVAYVNPVTDVQTAGMWHGKPARFEVPQSEVEKKGGCAVLLQAVGADGLPGAILGAAVIGNPERNEKGR